MKPKLLALTLIVGVCTALAFAKEKEVPVTATSKEALSEFDKGLDLLDRAHFAEAHECFTRAATLEPTFALARMYVGVTSPNREQEQREIAKALTLAANASEGERLTIEATLADANGNIRREIELLEKVITLFPGERRGRVALAFAHWQNNDYQHAETVLKDVVRLDPKFSAAYNLLGYTYAHLENYGEAEKTFKKYTQLLPKEANTHDSYAEILLWRGKFDESMKEYQEALDLDPHFTASQIGLANNCMFKGMTVEARKHAQHVVDSAPDDGVRREGLYTIAVSYIFDGKYDEAVRTLNQRKDIALKMNDNLGAARDAWMISTITLETSMLDANKGTYLKTRSPEASKVTEAATILGEAKTLVTNADVPADLKEVVTKGCLAPECEIALRSNDIATAKSRAQEYQTWAEQTNEQPRIREAHRLNGLIAIAERRFDDAVKELRMGDLRNPRTLLSLAEAKDGAGNTQEAMTLRTKILNNHENSLDLALARRELM